MALSLKDWLEAKDKDYGIGLAILGTHSKNRILLQNLSRKPNPKKVEYELRKIATQQGIVLTPDDQDLVETKTDTEKGQDLLDKMKKESPDPEKFKEEVLDRPQNQSDSEKNEEEADDIVSEKLNELESDADDIVSDKLAEFEQMTDEIIAGKKKVSIGGTELYYEDLPTEIKARLDQNRDNYKIIRATHEKLKLMENATDADRAPLTQKIADLDSQIRSNWDVVDSYEPQAETEKESAIDHKRINANRKYISTNLKKLAEDIEQVKAAKIRDSIKARLSELKAAGENLSDTTIQELKKQGFEC